MRIRIQGPWLPYLGLSSAHCRCSHGFMGHSQLPLLCTPVPSGYSLGSSKLSALGGMSRQDFFLMFICLGTFWVIFFFFLFPFLKPLSQPGLTSRLRQSRSQLARGVGENLPGTAARLMGCASGQARLATNRPLDHLSSSRRYLSTYSVPVCSCSNKNRASGCLHPLHTGLRAIGAGRHRNFCWASQIRP